MVNKWVYILVQHEAFYYIYLLTNMSAETQMLDITTNAICLAQGARGLKQKIYKSITFGRITPNEYHYKFIELAVKVRSGDLELSLGVAAVGSE